MGANKLAAMAATLMLGALVGLCVCVLLLNHEVRQIQHELRNYGCTASDVADAARAEAELRKLGDKNPVVRCAP